MELQKIQFQAKIKKEDRTLKQVLDARGITYPHPSLSFFHFIYAPLEDANKNGVRLASAAVEKSLNQLRGTQANLNHVRKSGYGSIIDAWVNKNDEIEIVIAFFKTLFPEDAKLVNKLAEEEKLFVSFELRTEIDTIERLSDGTRRLHNIEWEGVGILTNCAPAYGNAKILETATEIINHVFEESNNLMFASAKEAVDKLEVTIKTAEEAIKSNEEKLKMDKTANDALLAAQKKIVSDEFGELVKDWADEDYLNDEKIIALRTEIEAKKKPVEEAVVVPEVTPAVEEVAVIPVVEEATVVPEITPVVEETIVVPAVEEVAVVVPIEEEARINTTETQKVEDLIINDKTGELEQIIVQETVIDSTDGEVKRIGQRLEVITFTQEQVNEQVSLAVSAKEVEIVELKKQLEAKDNILKALEIRKELGKFIESFSDEQILSDTTIVENARSQKEAEAKELEIASSQTEEMVAKLDSETTKDESEEKELDKSECMLAFVKSRYSPKAK